MASVLLPTLDQDACAGLGRGREAAAQSGSTAGRGRLRVHICQVPTGQPELTAVERGGGGDRYTSCALREANLHLHLLIQVL